MTTPAEPAATASSVPGERRFRPTSRDHWMRLAERVMGDWTAKLRTALLLAALFLIIVVVIAVAFGLFSAAVVAATVVLAFLTGRRGGSSSG